ncbi:SDR family NAD(P)-dependent oxidoreductase (plasmid) [Georgenia sp. TF02-10]|uniref:SDR family NAD(P)-dependent oxidoreductase n=1 Tax=Georgenia sp. TF02-10 TaxID=2917725 RepID=UPI001FA783B1|nr:SDR family NAD(P)-dependent oxidoreductase [Georgenia sp. TF02-10]UNX56643.1 SDR family NAD(P)-dependent oxidoreductase [Georgenia sp. TF02-10]
MISSDDVVLVTGASSGIGLEVARMAAERGAHVQLLARGRSGLEEAAARCVDAGAASAQVLPCDVGDHEAVAAAVSDVVGRHGRLDAVVNAAGVFAFGRLTDVPAEVFERVVRTNLLGSANVARATLPVLRARGEGSLVLFGSLLGHIVSPYAAPYVVSKWGVRALVRVLQAENRDLPGIRVGYAAPAGVDTPIYQRAANYVGHPLRPPPPASDVATVARDVLDFLDGRRRRPFGDPLPRAFHLAARIGCTVLPDRLYDALGKVALAAAVTDRSETVADGPGAVLEPDVRTGSATP